MDAVEVKEPSNFVVDGTEYLAHFPSRTKIRQLRLSPDKFLPPCLIKYNKPLTAPHDAVPMFCHHYSIGRPITPPDLNCRMAIHPLVTKPALVPIGSLQNDRVCIEERIEKIRNRKKLSGALKKLANQFASELSAKIGHDLEPYDLRRVLDEVPRRDRLPILEELMLRSKGEFGTMRSFQKKEAYAEPKAPRNISPVPGDHLLETYRYTYPFTKAIKKCKFGWYCPGGSPEDIGKQIRRVTYNHAYFGADYSKFDGTQNRQLRRIAGNVVAMCFKPEHRALWKELYQRELDAVAKTQYGVSYKADGTMLSGSAMTTLGNTILNAFVYYVAFRRVGYDSETTWKCMEYQVALYGDDSAGPSIIEDSFFKVCEAIGLSATSEDCTHGLVFLGRIYFRDGEDVSIFDPRRILPKIHLITSPLGIPLDVAACNKAIGLLDLCKGEPLIEAIGKYMYRKYGELPEDVTAWGSEEHFKRHLRGRAPLPPQHLKQAMDLTALLLEVPVSTLYKVIDSYDADIETPAIFNNGTHSAKFPMTFISDPYAWDHIQVCY